MEGRLRLLKRSLQTASLITSAADAQLKGAIRFRALPASVPRYDLESGCPIKRRDVVSLIEFVEACGHRTFRPTAPASPG